MESRLLKLLLKITLYSEGNNNSLWKVYNSLMCLNLSYFKFPSCHGLLAHFQACFLKLVTNAVLIFIYNSNCYISIDSQKYKEYTNLKFEVIISGLT